MPRMEIKRNRNAQCKLCGEVLEDGEYKILNTSGQFVFTICIPCVLSLIMQGTGIKKLDDLQDKYKRQIQERMRKKWNK